LTEWGVALEESLQVAILNLRERTSPDGMKEIGSGLFVSQWGDCYDSARILLPGILQLLALIGAAVLFVPHRDQLWSTTKSNTSSWAGGRCTSGPTRVFSADAFGRRAWIRCFRKRISSSSWRT